MPSFLKSVRRLLLLSALALAPLAHGQIPGFPKTNSAPAAAAETPDQLKERLQKWLTEARASLARLEETSAEAQLPQGISPAALNDRRTDLDQTVRTINRTLSLLDELPDAETAFKAAETENSSWAGFNESPPHSILKLDDLVNQREATKEKDATLQSSVSIFKRSLDGIDKETKANEIVIRTTGQLVEKESADEAAKWRLEAARNKSRLLSARALFLRTNIELIEEQAKTSALQLVLIERKIAEISKAAVLSDEDLATVKKAAADRSASLQAESKLNRQRLSDASSARTRAKRTLDDLTAKTDPPATPEELALASARLATAEARVDSLQFISDSLESLDGLESFIPLAYEHRQKLMQSKVAADRKAALESLRTFLERLKAWEIVSSNELAAVNADLAKQDSNSATIPADDPRLPALADQRKALWDKQSFIQRISQTISTHRKNIGRWVTQFEEEAKSENWYSEISDSGLGLVDLVKKIWGFEVMKFENTRDVAGVQITDTRSVSLGIILSAVTFFIIAYLLSSRVSRRVQNVLVGRGRIAEAQANTLRNWLMIVVGFALALTTLHFLQIPLTVFAFFGGALAIGLGFGTQTLIKNFISGIIVLFERKIRVGDIVDIGGLSGSVSEINTRSSVLRGPDGRETLVPNSVFLENSVTNLTLSNRTSRRAILIGVAYGTSPQQVMTILTDCAARHGLVLKDPPPLVIFQDFADNSLLFKLYLWTAFDGKTNPELVESDVRTMIHKRFEETKISFPYPQRDLHLMTDSPLKFEVVPTLVGPENWPPKRSIP